MTQCFNDNGQVPSLSALGYRRKKTAVQISPILYWVEHIARWQQGAKLLSVKSWVMSCEVITRIEVNWGLTPIFLVLQGDICDLRSKMSERYFRFAVRSIECARPVVFAICSHKRQRRTLDLRSEVSPMPPAGLEPATRGLRVHCSTNWAKGAHWHEVVSMGKETYYMFFCASIETCYELTPHLVMLAGRRTKKCILQTYSLRLPLALFQATNSIRRLNMSWARNFLPIARRTVKFAWLRKQYDNEQSTNCND